jgi:predicted MFS family arabinose efflux permease
MDVDDHAVALAAPAQRARAVPLAVYTLGAGIFAMTTSEFMVAGLMPALSADLGASVGEIGFLISLYSAGMVLGGPLITVGLMGVRRRTALLWLTAVFVAGQALGALATGYAVLGVARVITGVASSAFFGVAISLAVEMSPTAMQGRAAGTVLGGLMVATVLGLPLATIIGLQVGWRVSFALVALAVVLCGGLMWAIVPAGSRPDRLDLKSELAVFLNGRLWAAYSTSGLVIGATFAAFSYLAPIFTDVAGFGQSTVPILFIAYGAATIVGNAVVGRAADRHALAILTAGLMALTLLLALFAVLAGYAPFVVIATIALGLLGVPMNPALVVRIIGIANPRPLVNAVHTAVICFGVVIGSGAGGVAIDLGWGLRAPLWIGAALAAAGLLTLVVPPACNNGCADSH